MHILFIKTINLQGSTSERINIETKQTKEKS